MVLGISVVFYAPSDEHHALISIVYRLDMSEYDTKNFARHFFHFVGLRTLEIRGRLSETFSFCL